MNVTRTFLPPQKEYERYLEMIWKSGWITNRGLLVKKLESELNEYLNTSGVICMTNGTLPLQIAIKALNLSGEIITTPFSYVATTSSIVWEGCQPVFVDIDQETLTINENLIEEAITKNTTAILATHVFGNPCNVEIIGKIAKKYDLKVIYDAAHCFDVEYKGKSIFDYGDVSTCSFHATKLFHTGEGGAIFCSNKELFDKLYYHHNFGHASQETYHGLGINAKMSELQAAMGLSVLPYMNDILTQRKYATNFYNHHIDFEGIRTITFRSGSTKNYAYYPIIFDTESRLLKVKKNLEAQNIFCRRYFYPSLEELPYVTSNVCKVAKDISKRILCLPLFAGIKESEQTEIINTINR